MTRISTHARICFPFAALGLLAVAGCTVTTGVAGDAGGPDGGSNDAGMPETGSSDDGGADGAAQDAGMDATGDAAACNGSQIPTQITASMTLTAACSPWHLTMPSTVGGPASPVLTIEPGVTILADPGSSLVVGQASTGAAGIVAAGTANAPIVMKSSAVTPAAGDWQGVQLGAQILASSKLSYVEIDYAGSGMGAGTEAAALQVGEGTNQASAVPLSYITIKHDAGDGIDLMGSNVGFGAGSGNLTIADWGSGDSPIVIDPNEANTLAGVSFSTGATGKDGQVRLTCSDACNGSSGVVNRDETWPSIAVPYLVDKSGVEIQGAGTSHATLTIQANTVMFTNDNPPTGIIVNSGNGAQGDLVATNVTFTSNSPSPSPGAWGGVYFYMPAQGLPGSSLTNCTFDYAGGNVWNENACTGVVGIDNSGNTGALPGPTIQGCTFENFVSSNAIGIVSSSGTNVQQATSGAYQQNNTFVPASKGVCGS